MVSLRLVCGCRVAGGEELAELIVGVEVVLYLVTIVKA